MAKEKVKELRDKSPGELGTMAASLEGDLFKLRLQHNLAQLENSAKIPQTRREIARVYTVINEKKRVAASVAKPAAPAAATTTDKK